MKPSLKPLLAATLLFAGSAAAASLDEVGALLAAGKAQAALTQIDGLGAEAGASAEARFLKATALAAAGRTQAAIELYQALIEESPASPEPYNNLAALYVRLGRMEEARSVLERAIRTDERYATVYDNLSLIYVEMARSSYARALRIEDDGHTTDLSLLYALQGEAAAPLQLAQAEPAGEAAVPEAAEASAVEQEAGTNEAPAAVEVASAGAPQEAEPEPAPQAEPVPAESTPVGEAVVATAPAQAVEPAPEEKPPATEAAVPMEGPAAQPRQPWVESVITTLGQWAQAWSQKEAETYLGFYAEDFDPGNGVSREAWAEQRRQRIAKPEWIKVSLGEFDIRQDTPEQVTVRLMQHYSADNYSDHTLKRLILVREQGQWRIISETSLKVSY